MLPAFRELSNEQTAVPVLEAGRSLKLFDTGNLLTAEHVNAGNSPVLNKTNNFSVEAWIKPNDTGTEDVVISRMEVNFAGAGTNGWSFGIEFGRIKFTTYNRKDYFSTPSSIKAE